MANGLEFRDGYDIAAHVQQYDASLAELIRGEEVAHQIGLISIYKPAARTTFVNDVGLPGRFQSETFARAKIRQVAPTMPEDKFEAEIAVRIARGERFKLDPCRVYVSQSVLEQDIPDAEACWGGLLRLAKSRTQNIRCRVIPDSAFAEDGQLAVLRGGGLVMPGQEAFYTEPNGLVASAKEALQLVSLASKVAYPDQVSWHLIEQRIS